MIFDSNFRSGNAGYIGNFHWFHFFDTKPDHAFKRLARLQSQPDPSDYFPLDSSDGADSCEEADQSEPYECDVYWLQLYFAFNPNLFRELYVDGSIKRYITERSANAMLILTNNADLLNYDVGIHYQFPACLRTPWITPYTCFCVLTELTSLPKVTLLLPTSKNLINLIQNVVVRYEYRELVPLLVDVSHRMRQLNFLVAEAFTSQKMEMITSIEELCLGSKNLEAYQIALHQIQEFRLDQHVFADIVTSYQAERLYVIHGGNFVSEQIILAILDDLEGANLAAPVRHHRQLLEFAQMICSAGEWPNRHYARLLKISHDMNQMEALLLHCYVYRNSRLTRLLEEFFEGKAKKEALKAIWANVNNNSNPVFYKDLSEHLSLFSFSEAPAAPYETASGNEACSTVTNSSGKVDLLHSAYNEVTICNINFEYETFTDTALEKRLKHTFSSQNCESEVKELVEMISENYAMKIFDFVRRRGEDIAKSPELSATVRWYMFTHEKQAEFFHHGHQNDGVLLPILRQIYSPGALNFIWLASNNVGCVDLDIRLEIFDEENNLYSTILPSSIAAFCLRVVETGTSHLHVNTLSYLLSLATEREDGHNTIDLLTTLGATLLPRTSRLYNPRHARTSGHTGKSAVTIDGAVPRHARLVYIHY